MSSPPLQFNQTCRRCKQDLAPGALVCERCHALVQAEELQKLTAEARSLEEFGDLRKAREKLEAALQLLPPDSTQAGWARKEIQRLTSAAQAAEASGRAPGWAARAGPIAALALALWKGKALLSVFKLNFLFSLAAFIGVYWNLFGMAFGLGFAAQILIHEMGHYVDIKRRGLPVDMPVFLPGLGAYVRWQALGVSNETRAAVSLAGPLAGLMAAAACAVVWLASGDDFWAALARTGAWLNVLNLIPVWALDGGQAASALGKAERWLLLIICLVLWLFLGQTLFFLVAGGVVYRLFTKDLPAQPSPSTAAYFVAVLVSLGVLMWTLPVVEVGSQ